MKKEAISYILMLIIALFPIMTACGGDDDDVTVKPPVNTNTNEEVTSPESNDNYYVKYEVEEGSQNSYGRAERTVVYKDVKEEKKITVKSTWDGTYGPFKKGDKVYLKAKSSSVYFKSNARISVSKNKEAFAIQAEERESEDIKLEYVIDY
ncbi:MAG: hypothetical protein IKW98_05215 [Prevotella sp.]|nr:hypothetical protein [Prevotella sp.]